MTADAWWWSRRLEGAVVGFTQRGRGASTGAYRGLNLGSAVEDAADRVQDNRTTVLRAVAELAGTEVDRVRPVFMRQVHGADVAMVPEGADLPDSRGCDGIVTTEPGVALFALVADCTPVLLHDLQAGVVAAVHAGRPGMLAGVVPAAVSAMRERGAEQIGAVVGPSVCGRCYEVPPQMRAEAASVEPVSATVTWTGTSGVDVAAGVVEQLRRNQVAVTWVPGCTREDTRLFSYRRDGRTGRFAGVIMLTGRNERVSSR